MERVDLGLVLLTPDSGFLVVAFQSDKLSVQADVGLLGLVVPGDPRLTVVFFRAELLLK